jgi:hypothetical protein
MKCVFDKFPKHRMNVLLENSNVKVGREGISELANWNEHLHKISIDNGVRILRFHTFKNLTVKNNVAMLQHP